MVFVEEGGSTTPVYVYFILPSDLRDERERIEKHVGLELRRNHYGFYLVPEHLVEKLQRTLRQWDDEYIAESWRIWNRKRR